MPDTISTTLLPTFRSLLPAPTGVLPAPHGRHTTSSLASTRQLPVLGTVVS